MAQLLAWRAGGTRDWPRWAAQLDRTARQRHLNLAGLVTRDSMIGVGPAASPVS